MMRNILVTGAGGQLGNEIRLLAGTDDTAAFFFTDVAELDICNEKAVEDFVSGNQIDIIVNCAAYTAVDKAEKEKSLCERLNRYAPGYLAKAVKKRNGSLIHISTDYVFDGKAYVPYAEECSVCPASVYGLTKSEGEQEAMAYCPDAMVIRTAWLYSSFGNNFVKTMLRLGRERESLGVVFDQIGTPTYARDLAKLILTIIRKGIVPGIYHYTNEGVCSWYDFAKAIYRLAGLTCRVRPLHSDEYPSDAPRPHYSVLDKTKIKNIYDVDIPYWEDSLKECLDKIGNKI